MNPYHNLFPLRPAAREEAGLFYSDDQADRALGTVGHVRMDFGSSGRGFYHTWWPHNGDHFNTPEFKEALQQFVDAMRADGPLRGPALYGKILPPERRGHHGGRPELWVSGGGGELPLLPPVHPQPGRIPVLPLLL